MELKSVVEWLMGAGYMDLDKGKPGLTAYFQKAYKSVQKDLFTVATTPEPIGLPTVVNQGLTIPIRELLNKYKYEDWVALYMQFIQQAQIPRRVMNSRGEAYETNKYSEDGMKAFQKAMKAGTDYELLVKSTMLSYKSGSRYKKKIGNYMCEGDWRSDYLALQEKAKEGETEVITHIKNELKDGSYNPYTLG